MKENLRIALDHIILMEVGKKGLQDGAPHEYPNDPGGFTIWGLSKRAHPWISTKTTRKEAEDVYEKVYWRAVGADSLPTGVDIVATDFSVTSGASVVRSILKEFSFKPDQTASFIKALSERRRLFYQRVVDANSGSKEWLKDWLWRTDKTEQLAYDMLGGEDNGRS